MTAPESRAPREGRTGEAPPCPDCGHDFNWHVSVGCAIDGCQCDTVDTYQLPAPPSVGDATPEAVVHPHQVNVGGTWRCPECGAWRGVNTVCNGDPVYGPHALAWSPQHPLAPYAMQSTGLRRNHP